MSYTTYAQINSLDEISFIAGTYYTLSFTVYDNNGALANISGATISWVMSPYGKPAIVTLNLSVTKTTANTFEVYLLNSATLALQGKYVHQPIITESGKTYRSQQGIINIIPAIN